MTKVNIHQAKTQFSRLVDLAAGGEEIIIAKAGQPVARLVPYQAKGVVRKPGAMRGKIRIKKTSMSRFRKKLLDLSQGSKSETAPRCPHPSLVIAKSFHQPS